MNDLTEYFRVALLPPAVDQFAVDDAECQLVERFMQAGYSSDTAPVKVRGLLRQVARGWGLKLPPHPDVPGENRLIDS